MNGYPMAAVERMMNIQEVILRAMAKRITLGQAAEILGLSDPSTPADGAGTGGGTSAGAMTGCGTGGAAGPVRGGRPGHRPSRCWVCIGRSTSTSTCATLGL